MPPHQPNSQDAKRRCHRCHGSGRAPCQICGGSGQVTKGRDRFGKVQTARCDGCFGTKTRVCAYCSGEGFT